MEIEKASVKYLIHNGEAYYPDATEYNTFEEAITAFKKLREERIRRIELGGSLFFDKDYLCIVIQENDPIILAKEVGVVPPK